MQTQIDECLTSAARGHPWLQEILAGRDVDPASLDVIKVVAGLLALTAGITDSLHALAREMDRQDVPRSNGGTG